MSADARKILGLVVADLVIALWLWAVRLTPDQIVATVIFFTIIGGTLFGNMTIIGSTANIIAIGLLEKKKLGSIACMTWLWPGLLISAVTLAIAMAGLWMQIPLMPHVPAHSTSP